MKFFERFSEVLGNFSVVFGNFPRSVWEVLGSAREVFDKCLGNAWEVARWNMGGVWGRAWRNKNFLEAHTQLLIHLLQ